MSSPIDSYVSDLRRSLSGPARQRRDLIEEIHVGLLDARDERLARGVDRRKAEREAVAEFGPAEGLAPLLQQELGLEEGRRTATLMLVVFALQPAVWAFAQRFIVPPESADTSQSEALVQGLGGAALGLAMAGFALGGAATRSHWIRAHLCRAVGGLAGACALVFVFAGVILMLQTGGGAVAWLWLLFWLELPMLGLAWAARRCLRAASSGA